jgi:ABC-type nickel/cobalt efflux system permease component RcnA
MMRTLLVRCAVVLLLALAGSAAIAQSGGGNSPAGPQRAFLPPGVVPGTVTPAPPAASGLYGWLTSQQAALTRQLTGAVRDIKTRNPWLATLGLVLLSFTYGVLHAAGPGHGKAVISSYVLANRQTVRRGIQLSFLSALFQAISAIVLVAVLVLAFRASGLTMKATEAWLEAVSWGLVTVLGLWLLWTQLRKLRPVSAAAAHAHGHVRAHGHHDHAHHQAHPHGHDHAHTGHHHQPPAGADRHTHDHGADHPHHRHHDPHDGHDHSACCGHAHMPAPEALQGDWSWRRALSLSFAVGIRPCTGAILILVFALSQGLLWAGVLATFAMALGTAITVSALAAIAVGSREVAARLGSTGNPLWGERVRALAGVAGALCIVGLGLMFFTGALASTGVF